MRDQDSKGKGAGENRLKSYEPPKILFRERLESVAAVCSGGSVKVSDPCLENCSFPLKS